MIPTCLYPIKFEKFILIKKIVNIIVSVYYEGINQFWVKWIIKLLYSYYVSCIVLWIFYALSVVHFAYVKIVWWPSDWPMVYHVVNLFCSKIISWILCWFYIYVIVTRKNLTECKMPSKTIGTALSRNITAFKYMIFLLLAFCTSKSEKYLKNVISWREGAKSSVY